MQRKISMFLVVAMLICALVPVPAYAGPGVERVSGKNRYETAVAVSKLSYDNAETVVIASGEGFADALAGGGLASAVDGPILLVQQTGIPDGVIKEIQRLGAKKVYLLGGTSTISAAAETQLKKYVKVERLSGSNRYETSVSIAKKVLAILPKASILVAKGSGFADALSAGGYIAKKGAALVLIDGQTASSSVMALKDKATEVLVLGGVNSVSKKVQSQLGAKRLEGKDRYETSLALAQAAFGSIKNAIFVDGTNYPDGLTSIALAKAMDAPIILAPKTDLSNKTIQLLGSTINIIIVGGTNSVVSKIEDQLNKVLAKEKPEKPDTETEIEKKETETEKQDPKVVDNIIEYKGKLTSEGQKDNYTFTAKYKGVYGFELSKLATNASTELYVFNERDEKILDVQTFGTAKLKAGEKYRVQVVNKGQATEYKLTIYEANPLKDISEKSQAEGQLRFKGQWDLYDFTAAKDGLHAFRLANLASGASTGLWVYNQQSQEILDAHTEGKAELEAGKIYTIYVVNYGKATGYKLTVTGP